jgi:transcription elongation factor GreA
VVADQNTTIASLGTWVKVREEGESETEVFYLVEGRFANVAENKLHPDNPMARALAGAKPGDEVCMDAPAGQIKFNVLEVGRDSV